MGPPRAWILRLRRLVLVLPIVVFVTIIARPGPVELRGESWRQESHPAKFGLDPTRSSLTTNERKEKVLEDPIDAVKLFNTTPIEQEHLTKSITASILLPPPMDLWRRGISLDAVYGNIALPRELVLQRGGGASCSCRNPKAEQECCERSIRLSHKMGTHMTRKLFKNHYTRQQLTMKSALLRNDYLLERKVDYRDVLMFRDIYAALKSGYLYHLTGMECWLDNEGRPVKNWNITKKRRSKPFKWFHFVTLQVPMSLHRNRSLCQFLAEEDEKVGMRVYIDFVFNGDYKQSLALWAMAHAFPEVRDRTRHACYEDFLSPTKDKQAIESTVSFLFNHSIEWEGNLPGQTAYAGPHAASHKADPAQSRRLLQIIRELDEEVFNNEITWVDSVLPC